MYSENTLMRTRIKQKSIQNGIFLWSWHVFTILHRLWISIQRNLPNAEMEWFCRSHTSKNLGLVGNMTSVMLCWYEYVDILYKDNWDKTELHNIPVCIFGYCICYNYYLVWIAVKQLCTNSLTRNSCSPCIYF